jgi:MinD-like ATPase involved in chromosome partitioning or flagellar assembly
LYVITFYSFKGGVGRTMALVNVAAELVRRGRKVLVVDFDLEAPGLETYKHLQPPRPHPGIVEYVTEYRRSNAVPDFHDYIYETKPIGKKGGRLWVMPAGRRDRAYRTALANLDWQRLYKEEEGFLLFEDTKLGWQEELKPDYVLIDSRTGDTDVLGICTRQLPDSVVLMFTPNEQNLAGLENVYRDIRREETEGLKKQIKLHFVAANVPDLDDEHRILRRQIQAFRERLEFEKLTGEIRRYENLDLLDQTVFTLDRPYTRLARAYRRLLRTLMKDNPADRNGVIVYELRKIAQRFWNADITILNAVGRSLIQVNDYRGAMRVFDRVLELEPDNADALQHRAVCKTKCVDGDKPAVDS